MNKIPLETVVETLGRGGLVVFPSDTVYGLLVDAANEKAVEKLIAFKERSKGKPISVFVKDFEMIHELTRLAPTDSDRLRQILPGPFTVVLKSKHKVSQLLESEKGSLGVRLIKYEAVNKLMDVYKKPVTATSANRSGHPPVHSIQALLNQLTEKQKKMIDLIVDVGELPRNKPSTVVDLTTDDVTILREGDLKFSSSKTYKSNSPEDTIEIGKEIMSRYSSSDPEVIEGESRSSRLRSNNKPLVFILEGDLGAGKTQFVKGVAQYLKIEDTIISPTFVISYEYPVKNSIYKNLIHMDLYNVKDEEEFKYLGIEKYLKEPNVFCIEWGEKAGSFADELKKHARLIYVHIKHTGPETRNITVRS